MCKMIITSIIKTPIGDMIGGATDEGVCLLDFSDRRMLPTEYKDLKRLLKTTVEEGENNHLIQLRKELNEYFEGSRKDFSVSLVTPGSEFQKSVWKELMNIPYGTTRSYLEQSVAIGKQD